MTRARVAVLPVETSRLRIDEIELPDPGPNQVTVKQIASGVCQTQLHQMRSGRRQPLVLGHESTGVVVATGRNVTHVREGDHVMITWIPRSIATLGRRPEPAHVVLADGSVAVSTSVFTWADHVNADEQFVVPLAMEVPTDVTSVIGCAVMTGAGAVCNSARVGEGDSVAVFGVGGVGLCAVAAAKVAGADPIIAVDLRDDQLDLALVFGATHVVNASRADAVAQIRELTRDAGSFDMLGEPAAGVDYAFDCVGLKETMDQAVAAARSGVFGARRGGTAVLVGMPNGPMELNTPDMMLHEKQLLASLGGSCQPARDFPVFIDWYRNRSLDLDALVTARYALDDINEATADLAEGRTAGRSILVFD